MLILDKMKWNTQDNKPEMFTINDNEVQVDKIYIAS